MKKIFSSILFLIISIAAFAQVGPNDLIIQGYVSNSQTSFAVSNWPVTISGMGMTETVYTNANGFYSDTISNGSETGPNQLFVIQTLNCDSSDVTDSVSNNQGTIDVATVNFQICAQNSNTCQALFNFNTSNIMATRQINFESTSTSIDPIATYQWSVDGTPISNNNNFFYLFPDNGGTVCLTVVSSSGCSDTYCQYVDSALCLPFFNYQASANNALEYTFTNTTSTTGQNATYYWYFGDGANSSQASPTHVYNQAGTYSVCLQVITEQCQNSMCQNITVVNDTTAGNGCIANFTYLADSTTIQFNNNSYTPSQPVFTWNFNDGTFSNELFPVHTYSNPGVYQVCLDVSTPTCSDSYCLQVYAGVSSIYTSCNAQFSYSGPQVADSSYQFIGVSNDESAYHLWTFGDGTSSTLEMPFHSYDVNGIYSVCHIVGINETCADTVCSIVNYFGSEPQCDAAFNVIDNSNFTATIRAVSLPTPGADYTWSISGPGYENIPFSGPQFLFTPVPNEPYYVCLDYINAETGCSASKCDTIVVQGILDNCSAEFTYMYDGYNLAYVEALPQYFLTSNSYIYSVYSTVYGNGMSNQVPGNAATLTIPSNAGTVTITLNVTNPFTGCNETVSKTFVVSSDTTNLAPCNAQFSYTGTLTADSSYQFIGVANDSSAYHLWTFGDGSSSTLEMPFHSYEVNGSYSVCHIVGINEACADTVCSVFNYFGTEPQCDAVFNVIDNGNGTFTVSPLSPPTPEAVITWMINGPGGSFAPAGYPHTFNYSAPNYPWSICMTYVNGETGCVATYCDTIVIDGITDTCSAEFTYTFTNDNYYTWPVNPHVEGNIYSHTVESSVYGILANNETSNNPGFPIPLDAGTVFICINLTNEFSSCNATFCDTVSVSPDTSCTADIVAGYGSNGLHEFSVNGGAEIASYSWQISPFDSNGSALETFYSSQSNVSIPAGTEYAYVNTYLTLTFETGCVWTGWLPYSGHPDSSITCNASIQYSYVGDVPNPSMFPYQFYSAYSSDTAAVIHSWVTSDAQTSSSSSPLFGFAPGTYTVCHSVSDVNGLCSDSTCISLTVVPDSLNGCTAMFSPALVNFITNEYLFSNTSSDLNASFIWQFGDGSTESGVNATHTFTSPGFYPVTLSMTGNGCFDDYTYNLTILPNLPSEGCSASFDYTSQVTNPLEVVFDASSSVVAGNNPSFIWNFGDGTTGTGSTVSHTYSFDGLYTVCLTAYSDSCSNTACGGVYAMFSDTTTICDASFYLEGPTNPDDYKFIGVGNNQNAYHLWTFGDGTSSTLAMPFHGYDNPGTYEVCHITGIEGVCADTVCNTFYIGLYILGTVNAGANCIDFGSVKLYSLDTLSNSVELIGQYPMVNNLCYYTFIGLTPGIYLLRAGLSDSSSYYNDYVPTYFGSQYYWFDAEPIYLTQSGDFYNISLIYGSNPGGNGTVNGSIDDGPFRLSNPELSSAQSPVLGAQVIITDLAGVPQRWVRTDNSGAFAIPDLAYGTYRLLADEPGMTCLPIEFTLSEQTPGVTIDLVMGDEISGIVSYETALVQGDVYPNPSNTLAKLNIELMKPASLKFTMTSITGQTTWIQTSELLAGKSTIQIPVQEMSDGLYLLSIYSENGQLLTTRKMQVAN